MSDYNKWKNSLELSGYGKVYAWINDISLTDYDDSVYVEVQVATCGTSSGVWAGPWGYNVSNWAAMISDNGTNYWGPQGKTVTYNYGSWLYSDYLTATLSKEHSERTAKIYADGDTDPFFNWSHVGNITISAKSSYTIEYNANDGSGETPSSQTKWYGETLLLSSPDSVKFTKTNCKFLGWSTTKNNTLAATASLSDATGTTYAAGGSFNENKTTILYAVWAYDQGTVTFDYNDGNITPPHPQPITIGEKVSLPSHTFDGYTFSGWSDGATTYEAGYMYTLTSAAVTFTAVWKYTISFNSNGGNNNMTHQEFIYGKSQALSKNTFVRIGYKFLGWSTNSTETSVTYKDEASLTKSPGTNTLYAVWEPITYTIVFNSNGGSGNMENQTLTYDESETLTNNLFTKTGYNFKGWATSHNATTAKYTDGAKETFNLSKTSQQVDLYAVWEPITYTIVFNSNDGSDNTKNQTLTYDVSQNLAQNEFKRDYYNFKGWATEKGATSVGYTDEATVLNLSETNANVNLYAVWTPINPNPIITNLVIYRCNENGNLDDDGTCAYLKFNYSQNSAGDKENSTIAIKINNVNYVLYEKDMTILSTTTNITIEGMLGILKTELGTSKTELGTFDTDVQYNDIIVTVTAHDVTGKTYTTTESTFLSKAFFTMDFLAGGTGIAIGSPSSSSGFIDGMDTGIFKDFVIYPKTYNNTKTIISKDQKTITITKDNNTQIITGTPSTSEDGTITVTSEDGTIVTSGGRNLYYRGIENIDDFDENTNYTVSDEKGIVIITNNNNEKIELQNVPKNDIVLDSLKNKTNLKIEKGPSHSSWTPAPEDAALMYLSQDGNTLNLRNPVISGGTISGTTDTPLKISDATISGGTISIPKITLTSAPANETDAANKKYVDDAISNVVIVSSTEPNNNSTIIWIETS